MSAQSKGVGAVADGDGVARVDFGRHGFFQLADGRTADEMLAVEDRIYGRAHLIGKRVCTRRQDQAC